jgi:type II secretory pathway pseudopilin PulG
VLFLGGYILNTGLIVLIVVLVILAAILIALTIFGKKAQKRQEEQQAQMDAVKQTVSMLIIDKKRMKLKEAGLPQAVVDATPKLLRGSKMPVIKAKVGPQIMTLICDEKIFDQVPVKKEVKATVSGIYVTSVKGLHGKIETPQKKQGFFKNLISKAQEKAGAKPVK